MGLENMRRWPTYILLAVCITLLLSLMNSWSIETELQKDIHDISAQLRDCAKQQSICLLETGSLRDEKDQYVSKVNNLQRDKEKLTDDIGVKIEKSQNYETKLNKTHAELGNCKVELESLKNLKVTYTATLDALRLKEDELTKKLKESNKQIEQLQNEIEKLKSVNTAKNSTLASKVTPGNQIPKISSSINAGNPQQPALDNPQQLALDNAAKEEMEESNINEGLPNDLDGNGFDPSFS